MIASPARFLLLPVIAGLLTLSGCGTYRNATAYFNTYYNASQLFDQAVTEMLKSPQTARDSNYFAPYNVPQPAVAKFERVIEKASRVMQFHSESGYVEDAIMMVGKSYLYQNKTELAAAKFLELLDNFPESGKRAEARLWYAKTFYQGKNDEVALIAAKELAVPNGDGDEGEIPADILLETTMLEAQIYADRGEFVQAAATLGRTEAINGDGELKAIAQYQLGTVYEQTQEYVRAAEAYGLVGEYSPTPIMSFNALLRQGAMLSKAGRPEDGLKTFDELIAQPLKPEQSALVDFEIANAYWARGDSAAAFTLYDIIDSTYKNTDAAARSYYKRGEILEKQYRNLAGAREYYLKAKSEFPASPVTQPAAARLTSLEHYLKTHERLAKDDSSLQAILYPDTIGAKRDTAALVVGVQGDTVGFGAVLAGDGKNDSTAESTSPEQAERRNPTAISISSEDLSMRAIRNRPRHLVPDPDDPDYVPPSDKKEQIPEDPEAALAGKMNVEQGKKTPVKTAEKNQVEVTPKASEISKSIAESQYELGGILLLDLGLPDSALFYYNRLVREHPESPLVPKALYAMSEVYKLMADTGAVDSLYDLLLNDHPETEYADQVRKLRGLDTAGVVETMDAIRYRKAEAVLFGGNPNLAVAEFKAISAQSQDTLITPKAYYAVGWIYENVSIHLDSAEAWYKILLKKYPSSVYARSAEPRIAVREDTSKLKKYVKIKEIQAIRKPQKEAVGQVPTQGVPGNSNVPPPPGELNQQPVDPEKEGDEEEADPDVKEEDTDDEEPVDPDDDPGSAAVHEFRQPGTAHIPL